MKEGGSKRMMRREGRRGEEEGRWEGHDSPPRPKHPPVGYGLWVGRTASD